MTRLNDIVRHAVGLPVDSYYLSSGSATNEFMNSDEINLDGLWDRMYVNPKPVIITCVYCQAHNAFTSPCCIQCGAPMGASARHG